MLPVEISFENKNIEIIIVGDQTLFNPRDVGECLGISESTVRDHLQEMSEKQVVKITNKKLLDMLSNKNYGSKVQEMNEKMAELRSNVRNKDNRMLVLNLNNDSNVDNIDNRMPVLNPNTHSDVDNIDIETKSLVIKPFTSRKINNAGENFITESGLYKLIFKSNRPDALRFQDWVCDEVLPAINKTGKYINNQVSNQSNIASTYKALLDTGLYLGLSYKNAIARACIALEDDTGVDIKTFLGITPNMISHRPIAKPKVSEDGYYTVKELSKRMGMSSEEFNKILVEMEYQHSYPFGDRYFKGGFSGYNVYANGLFKYDFDRYQKYTTRLRWKECVMDHIWDYLDEQIQKTKQICLS